MKIAFIASQTPQAQQSLRDMHKAYPHCAMEEADVVVTLGGDGHLLEVLHRYDKKLECKPVYGMNVGTIGFLLNSYAKEGVLERIQKARNVTLRPLVMRATTTKEGDVEALAINEVSLLRQTRQAAKLRILIDGIERMPQMVCDGAILATPAGSTAYNYSAHGPILPLSARLLGLTPLSPFRPRRWRGALLPDDVRVCFEILEPEKRPVSVVADSVEIRDVAKVVVYSHQEKHYTLLFDPDQPLEERIFQEQFAH